MVGTRTSRDDIRGGSLRLYRPKTRVSYDRRVRSTPSRHSRAFVSLRAADNSSDTFEFPAVAFVYPWTAPCHPLLMAIRNSH